MSRRFVRVPGYTAGTRSSPFHPRLSGLSIIESRRSDDRTIAARPCLFSLGPSPLRRFFRVDADDDVDGFLIEPAVTFVQLRDALRHRERKSGCPIRSRDDISSDIVEHHREARADRFSASRDPHCFD